EDGGRGEARGRYAGTRADGYPRRHHRHPRRPAGSALRIAPGHVASGRDIQAEAEVAKEIGSEESRESKEGSRETEGTREGQTCREVFEVEVAFPAKGEGEEEIEAALIRS